MKTPGTLILSSILLSSIAMAAPYHGKLNAPKPSDAIQGSASVTGGESWVDATVALKNIGTQAADFNDSTITFDTPSEVNDINGDFSPLSYPSDIKLSSTYDPKQAIYHDNVQLTFPNDSWAVSKLPENASFNLQFGFSGDASKAKVTNIKTYLNGGPIPVAKGEISIQAPTAPGSDVSKQEASAEITGPGGYKKDINVSWQQNTALEHLQNGLYTIHTNNVGDYAAGPDQQITLTKEQPKQTVTLNYDTNKQAELIASLEQPGSNLPTQILKFKDLTVSGTTAIEPMIWNQTKTIKLTSGDQYQIWADSFSQGNTQYTTEYSEQKPYVLKADNSAPTHLVLHYTSAPIPTYNINVSTTGLPSGGESQLNFTGTKAGNTVKQSIKGGQTSIKLQDDTYNVAATDYVDNQYQYVAKNLKSPFTVSDDSNYTVTFSKEALPQATFAPYTDMTNWPYLDLNTVNKDAGVKNFTMAFLVNKSPSACEPSWGTYFPLDHFADQITTLRKNGGGVVVSFGGASNTPMFASNVCHVTDLTKAYQDTIDTYHTKHLDFDIEGGWITKLDDIKTKLVPALLEIQKNNPDVKISFTIAVLPQGLVQDGKNLLTAATEQGLNYSVNIMAMDYGSSSLGKDSMGQAAIDATKNTAAFLKTLYPNDSDTQIYGLLGTTPMIGQNDVPGEIFTTADAKQFMAFAKEKKLGFLGFWDLNRDKACSSPTANVDLNCSSVAQTPYEFSTIFMNQEQ